MTLTQLKEKLNSLRTDPGWKRGWEERGADFGAVCRTIREKLLPAAVERLEACDLEGWEACCKIILGFAAYENWDALILPTLAGADPTCEEDEAVKAWTEFITSCNPNLTFGQATALFHQRNGFWPKRDWPGMPIYQVDRMARIKNLPMERRVSGLPKDALGGPIPD